MSVKLTAVFLFLACTFVLSWSDAQTRDLYGILGVSKTATESEIKSAHRRLVRKYHPDFNPGDTSAKEKFLEVQEAYEVLSDPKRRSKYDQFGVTTSEDAFIKQYQAREAEERIRRADEVGAKYSNEKWGYDSANHRFYDNRVRKWSMVDNVFGSFYTAEGWVFYPNNGTYLSVDLGAEWNPEDGRGWIRTVSNFNSNYIPIDFRTGFARSTTYNPRTVSDSSELFDRLFNPVNVLDAIAGRTNRKELIQTLETINWTPERKADFIERAKAHTRIFKHRDMEPKFTTHIGYSDAFMDAILDNPISREFSEIVIDFIRGLPERYFEHLGRTLVKPEWLNHPNASNWTREIARNERAMSYFISSLFITKKDTVAAAKEFEKVFPIFRQAGFKSEAIGTLLRYLGSSGDSTGFEVLKDIVHQVTRTPEFFDFVAGHETKGRETIDRFLEWYREIDPSAVQVFAHALEMPSTDRNDYYRLTPDRTEYKFAESQYNSAKRASMDARISFIKQRLAPISAIPGAKIKIGSCRDLLGI